MSGAGHFHQSAVTVPVDGGRPAASRDCRTGSVGSSPGGSTDEQSSEAGHTERATSGRRRGEPRTTSGGERRSRGLGRGVADRPVSYAASEHSDRHQHAAWHESIGFNDPTEAISDLSQRVLGSTTPLSAPKLSRLPDPGAALRRLASRNHLPPSSSPKSDEPVHLPPLECLSSRVLTLAGRVSDLWSRAAFDDLENSQSVSRPPLFRRLGSDAPWEVQRGTLVVGRWTACRVGGSNCGSCGDGPLGL